MSTEQSRVDLAQEMSKTEEILKKLDNCEKKIQKFDLISRWHLEGWLLEAYRMLKKQAANNNEHGDEKDKKSINILKVLNDSLNQLEQDITIDNPAFYTKLNLGLTITSFIVACGILHQQPLLQPSLDTTGLIALSAVLFAFVSTKLIEYALNSTHQKLKKNINVIRGELNDANDEKQKLEATNQPIQNSVLLDKKEEEKKSQIVSQNIESKCRQTNHITQNRLATLKKYYEYFQNIPMSNEVRGYYRLWLARFGNQCNKLGQESENRNADNSNFFRKTIVELNQTKQKALDDLAYQAKLLNRCLTPILAGTFFSISCGVLKHNPMVNPLATTGIVAAVSIGFATLLVISLVYQRKKSTQKELTQVFKTVRECLEDTDRGLNPLGLGKDSDETPLINHLNELVTGSDEDNLPLEQKP